MALFAGYDRDGLNMAWWQLNQDDHSDDLTSRCGIAAGLLARASAFDAPGTRGRRAALDAEAYATRITKTLKTSHPRDAEHFYIQAQEFLIGYRADELASRWMRCQSTLSAASTRRNETSWPSG